MNKNVYQIITEKIIQGLEKGLIPWKKPWRINNLPVNHNTNRAYTGINSLLLNMNDFRIKRFITWNGAKNVGAEIKNEERKYFQIVTYWNTLKKEVVNKKTGEKEVVEIPFMRYYKVWNIEQTTLSYTPKKEKELDFEPIIKCENIWNKYEHKPSLQFKGSRAYYESVRDIINLPKKEDFKSVADFYATLWHECIHSTGHISRLRRSTICKPSFFGTGDYSKEELVAEIGASFLCGQTGINTTQDNSQAYINGWLDKLRGDSKLIIKASSEAQKAVDYIMDK